MRKFILYSLVSLACLALAGCAGDGREEREPANALLLEGLMAGAMADCGTRLEAGEFTTHVERARCEGVEARGSVEGLGMEYAFGDLVTLMSEWRMRLARERDAGTLDATGERARQKEFDTAFLREMDVRERLHNDGVRAIEFNFCEIEGNGLSCAAQSPTSQIEIEFDRWNAECEQKRSMGYFENLEAGYHCLFWDGLVSIYERSHFPHMGLVKTYARFMVNLARRWDNGKITIQEFERKTTSLKDQYASEVSRRDTLRAIGDPSWRTQECRIIEDQLLCFDPDASG